MPTYQFDKPYAWHEFDEHVPTKAIIIGKPISGVIVKRVMYPITEGGGGYIIMEQPGGLIRLEIASDADFGHLLDVGNDVEVKTITLRALPPRHID